MAEKEFADEIRGWEEFYRSRFGFSLDLSHLINNDEYDLDSYFTIVIPKGLTMNNVLCAMRQEYRVLTCFKDLDGKIPTNERTAEAADYVIFIKRSPEPDEELADFSADSLREIKGFYSITVLERMVAGFKYFCDNGSHFDITDITLCTGSRDFEGDIISIHCDASNTEIIDYYLPDDSGKEMRSREVFFL